MKWRVFSIGRFYDAGESTVVYFDSHSGDTHLLSDFAAHILQQFANQPLTTEELVNRVLPDVEPGDMSEVTASVSGVLQELVTLDIVKQG